LSNQEAQDLAEPKAVADEWGGQGTREAEGRGKELGVGAGRGGLGEAAEELKKAEVVSGGSRQGPQLA
jgi:hypothetical protein